MTSFIKANYFLFENESDKYVLKFQISYMERIHACFKFQMSLYNNNRIYNLHRNNITN